MEVKYVAAPITHQGAVAINSERGEKKTEEREGREKHKNPVARSRPCHPGAVQCALGKAPETVKHCDRQHHTLPENSWQGLDELIGKTYGLIHCKKRSCNHLTERGEEKTEEREGREKHKNHRKRRQEERRERGRREAPIQKYSRNQHIVALVGRRQ